jgi:hypothetical protein
MAGLTGRSRQGPEKRDRTQDSHRDSIPEICPDDASVVKNVQDTDERKAEDGQQVPVFGPLGRQFPDVGEVFLGGESVGISE